MKAMAICTEQDFPQTGSHKLLPMVLQRHGAPSPNHRWLINLGQSSPPCIHFQCQWFSWKFAGHQGLLLEQTTAKMSSLLKLIGNSCAWFGSSAGLAPPASKLGVDSSPNASSLGTTSRPAGCCFGRLTLMKVSFYLVWLFFIEKTAYSPSSSPATQGLSPVHTSLLHSVSCQHNQHQSASLPHHDL